MSKCILRSEAGFPAKLVALFKIWNPTCDDMVLRLASVQMLTPVNSGSRSDVYNLVTQQEREDAREFTIVNIATIPGLADLIPEADRRRLVNNWIEQKTFNKIY